jgi:hypothetical protein
VRRHFEYYFTYIVRDNVVELHLVPRVEAEKFLNENGLTTHEPFNPLKGTGSA